jgi:hypothetical protein
MLSFSFWIPQIALVPYAQRFAFVKFRDFSRKSRVPAMRAITFFVFQVIQDGPIEYNGFSPVPLGYAYVPN